MNRTPLLIVASITLLLLGGGVIAYLTFRETPPAPEGEPPPALPDTGGGAPPPADGTLPPDGLPEAGLSIRQIIDKPVLAPTTSKDGRSIYFILRENGRLMTSGLDGAGETALTTVTVPEAFDAAWSPLKTKALITYHENGTVKRFLEETATTTPSRFLPQALTSFAWSPDGKSMAYLLREPSRTTLVIADQNGKNIRTVFSTPIPDLTVQWASPAAILLVSRPSGLAPSIVLRFDVKTKRTSPLLAGTYGLTVLPKPDGSGFAFSRTSPSGQAEPVAMYTFADGRTAPLRTTTMVEKCAFSPDSKRLYCGVPREALPRPMPDLWYRGQVSFSDAIVELDLAANQMRTLVADAVDVDVTSPVVSPDGSHLFFVDKKTGTLWRVILEQ